MNRLPKQDMNSQLAGARVLPLLVRLTIPITIAQLVNALYSIVDRIYIGHMPQVGTLALGGIGITFPIIMIIAAFSCIPGMGGAPLASIAMGIAGAAIATVISQMVSALWVLRFLVSGRATLRLGLDAMKPRWDIIRPMCVLGISPFTFRVNESIVVVVLNWLLIRYGGAASNLHIASMALLTSISQVFFMPLIGIITGAQPILSYNLGAGNFARIKETIHYSRILSISCAVIMWFGLVAFPGQICRMFTSDGQLISLTTVTMRIMFSTVLVVGLQMVNQNAFVALGNTWYSFIFGIMRKLILLLPLAIFLPYVVGVWGIYMAEAISNVLTTVITHIYFTRYMKRLANGMPATAA